IVSAHLDRLDGRRGGAVSRHHHHGGRGVRFAQGLQSLEAVAVRQPDVQEDDRGTLLLVEGESLFAAGGGEGGVAFVGEDASQGGQDPRLVVNNQDELSHETPRISARKDSRTSSYGFTASADQTARHRDRRYRIIP